MARPLFTPTDVNHGDESWDGAIRDNFTELETLLSEPFPVPSHGGDETNLEATFRAIDYDRSFIWVNDTTFGWNLFFSDGTAWVRWPGEPVANQVDSAAGDVATLKTDFNALLTKLRNSGIMLP